MNYEDLSCAENLSFQWNQYTSGNMSNDSVRKDSPLSGILVYLVFPTSTLFCVCLVAQSCLTLCDPHGLQPARFLYPWVSPGKNTGTGSHSLLQGIFKIQGWNLGLLHCRQLLYHLSHEGSSQRLYVNEWAQLCDIKASFTCTGSSTSNPWAIGCQLL